LAGVYGSHLTLASGGTELADEAYLRDAILNPSDHMTQGFAPIMPTYQGQISEDGVISLVEYIKSLNSNNRVEQTLNTTALLPEGEGKTTPAGQAAGAAKQGGAAGTGAAGQGVVKP
jgi:cytochrome c oxidase subunit 2